MKDNETEEERRTRIARLGKRKRREIESVKEARRIRVRKSTARNRRAS